MNKLTLAELSAYLPHDLEVLIQGTHTSSIANLTKKGFDSNFLHALSQGWVKILDLRPLSQLTQEIEHNGQKFVPIEEIAKIEAPAVTGAQEKIHSITSFNRGLSFNSRQRGVTYKYEGVAVEITHYKDAVFHKKVINGNDSWVFSYFHNYPEILRKLHEWHFYVFGLIDRGLALAIEMEVLP